MPRYFHIDEARKLLAQVDREIRRAIHLREEHSQAESELQGIHQRVAVMGGIMLDREKMLAVRARRDATAMRLKELIEQIHGMGCQIKDLEIGLIDFPTLYHGNEVLLCWRLGEDDIEYWHGLEEGFRGRKPIDQEFLENHGGDRIE
jgi:hypothetical protein